MFGERERVFKLFSREEGITQKTGKLPLKQRFKQKNDGKKMADMIKAATKMPIICPLRLKPLSQEVFKPLDFRVMELAFASQNELGKLCDEVIYQHDLLARLKALTGNPDFCHAFGFRQSLFGGSDCRRGSVI